MASDKPEWVHIEGVYRLMVGEGLNFKVMRREGPLWRVIWLNGARQWGDLSTVQITACSELLKVGKPVPAWK
jgi:hypothetical protein